MTAELLWSLLTKGSLIVVLAFFASLALRKTSASKRHTVWLGAVLAMLLLPLAAIRLPDWSVSVERAPVAAPLVVPTELRSPSIAALRPFVPGQIAGNASAPQPRPKPVRVDIRGYYWRHLLPKIWFAGFFLVLLYTLAGHLRVAKLVRSSRTWDDSPLQLQSVTVRLAPGLEVPATCGFFRPVILLPEAATEWDRGRLEMVVAHELGHVRRNDWLWQVASQLVEAVHFFNPLAWLVARQLRKESEFACDDLVLLKGAEPTAYAQLLVDVARSARTRLTLPTVGMAASGEVEDRLKAIVDLDRRRSGASKRILGLVLAVSVLICLPLAALRAQHAKTGRFWSDLPPIPLVQSPQSSPNHYVASNWIAGLPNGFRVRLVGVSAPQDYVWGADGKEIADSDKWGRGAFDPGSRFHLWTWGINRRDRYIYIEAESPKAGEATFSYQTEADDVKTARRSRLSYSHDLVQFQPDKPQFATIDLDSLPWTPKMLFRVGVATGWKTLATVKNPYKGPASGIVPSSSNGGNISQGCGVMLDGTPTIFYQYAPGKYKEVKIEPNHLDNSIARRVLAYDAQGAEVKLPKDDRIVVEPAVFCKIDKFVLQTSQTQWAEFRDVPTKRDLDEDDARRLDPGIRGTAKGIDPSFERRLPNGVTVGLESVTAAAHDGEVWRYSGQPSWQPSGAVLAQAQLLDKKVNSTPRQGPEKPVYFQVDYSGLPEDANTVVRTSGEKRKYDSREPGQIPGPSRVGPMSREAFYDPTAQSTDVKVGVATAPWRPAFTYRVDHSQVEVAEKTLSHFSAANRSVIIHLGPIPVIQLSYLGPPEPMTTTNLGDVAMRIIAITKDGKENLLKPSSWQWFGGENFDLPIKPGQGFSPQNPSVQDIAAFRIETRPYEWVSFPGVFLKPKVDR